MGGWPLGATKLREEVNMSKNEVPKKVLDASLHIENFRIC